MNSDLFKEKAWVEIPRLTRLNYAKDIFFGVKHESAQGLLTGSYVRQLDDLGKGEFAVHYYDVKGRGVQKRSSLLPYNYLFLYDGLNRLTVVNSYDKTGNGIPYSELYEYDNMGNVTYLERKLGENKTDALNIQYTGNQIKKVSSGSPALGYDFGSMTYLDLADATIEYYYDNNGNLITNLDKGIVSVRYNFLNLPDTIQFQNGNQIINSYLADGRKVKAVYKTYSTGIVVPQDGVYHGNASCDISTDEWDGHYMYRTWFGGMIEMFMVQTPEGYIGTDHIGIDSRRNYAYYYYVHDHLGNVRITRNSQGYYADQSLEYYPSGVLFDRSAEKERQPYMFGGKELVSMHGLNEYDFTGRWQDPLISSFTSIDPLCEKYYSVSPYVYCLDNPINHIDPDGRREWPVNSTYKGYGRRHENNFGATRPNGRVHKGVDINHTGGGNTDKGAPIIATHDGTITRVVTIGKGDKDAGGNRVQITSSDGSVSTYYMHLDKVNDDIQTGTVVMEGQQIGTMGGSGKGKSNAYTSHLHYEIKIDGVKVNPTTNATGLIDPQQLIAPLDGGTLPEIVVTAPKSVPAILIPEIKPISLPNKLEIQ